MKILPHITLALAIVALGVGTLSVVHSANAGQTPQQPLTIERTISQPDQALAAPLLHRVFISDCLQGQRGPYRESLEFSADGTTRFSQSFYPDAQCRDASTSSSVREGHYALSPDEGGRLLLTVRHLQGQKSEDAMPYFEALITVDHDRLVMENGVASSLQYTAKMIPI